MTKSVLNQLWRFNLQEYFSISQGSYKSLYELSMKLTHKTVIKFYKLYMFYIVYVCHCYRKLVTLLKYLTLILTIWYLFKFYCALCILKYVLVVVFKASPNHELLKYSVLINTIFFARNKVIEYVLEICAPALRAYVRYEKTMFVVK